MGDAFASDALFSEGAAGAACLSLASLLYTSDAELIIFLPVCQEKNSVCLKGKSYQVDRGGRTGYGVWGDCAIIRAVLKLSTVSIC